MKRPLVLIADDYPDALDMYAAYLDFQGFEVVTALDGHAALEAARRCRPDVVLLDLRMPVKNGLEVMKELKADGAFAAIPILALTAHALPEERDAALRAGFDGFLSKPLQPDDLASELRRRLTGRS